MRKGKISARFRRLNIMLFALAFVVMMITSSMVFDNVISQLATDYARQYASSSANALSAHISKEIGLMSKAARSSAVTEWLADEGNKDKMALAYEELSGIISGLYSSNLYVGVEKSLHEYSVDEDHSTGAIRPFAELTKRNPDDAWYFECVESGDDYSLSVAIDHVLDRKRVWLDCKVVRDGTVLGVICTGLEFSHIAGELFSQYDSNNLRGLIIDKNGVIYMDSLLVDNDDFMYNSFESRIEDEFISPEVISDIRSHLDGIDGYFKENGEPTVIKLKEGQYRYMTIAPVILTNWSAVTLYDPAPLLGIRLFLPAFIAMVVLLVAIAFATNVMSRKLIFSPLEKLNNSLGRLNENYKESIYGTDRDDEFGNLSNSINDLFTKANYDALTGIFNRRFLETNIQRVTEFLSRSSGYLSVLMVDVDFFKLYNDTYGHDQGDVCLKAVAGTMANIVTRANDFTARYGGEEFVIILPNTEEYGACWIATKLLEDIRALGIPHEKSAVADCVTVSVGVATGKVDFTHHWTDYVKRADEALYLSKQSGRNKYTYLDFSATEKV